MLAIISRDHQHIAKDVQHRKGPRPDHGKVPLADRRDEVHGNLRWHRAGAHQQRDCRRCAPSRLTGDHMDHLDLRITVEKSADQVEEMRRLVVEESQGQRLVPLRKSPSGIRELRAPQGLDLAQPAVRDQLAQAQGRARELKVVHHGEDPFLPPRDVAQLARLVDLERHRFFEQHVLPRLEVRGRQGGMGRRGSCDRHGVDAVEPGHRTWSFRDGSLRDAEQRFRPLDLGRGVVDHADHLHVRAPPQPRQMSVRADPTESDNRNPQSAHVGPGSYTREMSRTESNQSACIRRLLLHTNRQPGPSKRAWRHGVTWGRCGRRSAAAP